MLKPVEQWEVDDVAQYLERIDLGDLKSVFRSNEVQGKDLLTLTESELKEELHITRLQAKRVKDRLPHASDDTDAAAGAQQRQQQQQEDGGEAAGAQGQSLADEGLPPAPEVDTSGAIPHAEAPDLDDRDALRPTAGSFSRAPAPAPVIGVPAETVPAVHVDKAIVKTYAETTSLIAKLEAENVTVLLPSVREALVQVEKQLGSEQKKFQQLSERQEQAQQEVEEAKSAWFPGKYLGLGKFKDAGKVEAAEQAAEKTALKVKAAGAVLERMHAQRASLKERLADLTTKVKQLQEARQWEEGVLRHVFAGVAGDDKENALEAEVDVLVPKLQQARSYSTSYGQAFELTRSARKQLTQAQELFNHAYGKGQGRARVKLVGTDSDRARRAQSQQAAELANAACDAVLKAQAIIPAVPINTDKAKALRGMQLAAITYDSRLGDEVAMNKIDAGMRMVDDLLPEVVAAEQWLAGWLRRVRQDQNAAEQAYSEKKAALDDYRRDLMTKIVQASHK